METPTATCAWETGGIAKVANARRNKTINLVERTIEYKLTISGAGALLWMPDPGSNCVLTDSLHLTHDGGKSCDVHWTLRRKSRSSYRLASRTGPEISTAVAVLRAKVPPRTDRRFRSTPSQKRSRPSALTLKTGQAVWGARSKGKQDGNGVHSGQPRNGFGARAAVR